MSRLVSALVLAALALGACGKRGALAPPEGETAGYSYPRTYPDPGTVDSRSETQARPRTLEAPTGAGDLSPFPKPDVPVP